MAEQSTVRIGAHVDQTDPVAEATARGADLVQFFLGDPQGYKGPEVAYAGGADGLRAAAEAAGVDLYVHAPYIVNVATTNNRIRIPSRKLLQQHVDAAAAIGAKGLIVHGGHVNKADDPAKGFDNWRKAVEATDLKLPLLIENTAGGDNAMTRYLDRIARVWDAISTAEGFEQVGFCLDTCHAHAGGNDLATVVQDVAGGDRADRPGALQRQPRRVRLRRRPARQLRRRAGSTRSSSPPWSARPARRWSARPRAARRSTAPTSRSSASGCDAPAHQPAGPARGRRAGLVAGCASPRDTGASATAPTVRPVRHHYGPGRQQVGDLLPARRTGARAAPWW